MRSAIDSYDLIQSGFANDLTDCAQVYWLIGNAQGMQPDEVQAFMDRIRLAHVAVADTENSSVTPYTQEIPYNAREAYLNRIANSIYRDFGAFNPEDVAAGNVTATQINAAYQPMDEEADDFEYQIIEFIQQILRLQGIEAMPQFKRNRISNQLEQVQMVMQEANYLDDETVLSLLPNITPDMIEKILAAKDEENADRLELENEALRQENDALKQPQEETQEA
jgi:SPP1 family phage portal protein